jgi:hypothetical protein
MLDDERIWWLVRGVGVTGSVDARRTRRRTT